MFYISVNGTQIYKPLDDQLILFNPKLTLEMGKAGSLEFDIPPDNPYYDRLNQLTTEVTVDMDSEEIFHGRVLSNERMFNNLRHVYCEGDLSYLIDSVQKGVQYSGKVHSLFNQIITNHNARVNPEKRFVVGNINIENRDIILVGHSADENINVGAIDYKQIAIDSIVDEWNNTFDYIQTCIIDYCGGYLRTRRVNGTTYIDLLTDFGNDAVQPIELGRNLLDLTEEISVEDVFTVLIPLGDDNLTIASVNGGSDELVDTASVNRFGRIVRTHVFSNVNNPHTLLENARRYLAENLNIPRTVSVRAIDLHLINKTVAPIRIGDRVAVTSYVHEVDDILTCTKIEYDLERPENNNYTFGNPKQTLTQRFREDARLNNDTYGNSAASPTAASAKGASAAAATAKQAESEKDKALKDFYDAWINVDKDQAHIDLGALYKKYIDGKQVLISQCGIDLDGVTGNVNIKSLHNVVDSHGRKIAQNEAKIGIIETDTAVAIESVTRRQDDLADREATHYTEIKQQSDTLGSSIELLARDLNSLDNRTTNATANLGLRADDIESRISANATYLGQIDGREVAHYASIQAWANEAESAIALKADKVYVDGLLEAASARIDSLMSGNSTAQHILANTITANSIKLKVGSGTADIVSTVHSHNISTKEGDNGEITISIGSAVTDQIPQQASFNIANTKFYKDNVAAKTITSLDLNSEAPNTDGTGYRYETANKRFLVYVKATMSDNSDFNGGPIYVPAGVAWNAGKDAGAETAEVLSVLANGQAGVPIYDDEDQVWYANIPYTAVAQGTRSNNSTYTSSPLNRNMSVNVTAIYEKGKADGSQSGTSDVSVLTLGLDPDNAYWYSSSVDNYYIPIKAELSNDRYSSTTITISGEAARNSVNVSDMRHYTVSGEQTVTYNSTNVTLNASVQATLTNGQTPIRTVTIPATLAYDAGAAGVKATEIKLNTNWTESSTGYIYETANRRFRVRIIANLNNSTAWGSTVYVPAGEAFDAGVASASGSVTISEIKLNTAWATSSTGYVYQTANRRYAVNIRATASNDNYSTQTVYVPAADAIAAGYSQGYDDGEDSVTVSQGSSITESTYQSAYRRYSIKVQAPLTNGYSPTLGPFYLNASDAYNAGYYAGQASVSGYTNIYYTITDSQTSSKVVINVVVYGYNGSYYEAVASGRHEYAK